jgi:sulfur-carrier protein adenylyltransferase/sulfurtransferase
VVADWSASELAEQLKRSPKSIVLLDVREPYEREMALIDPSLHIPMSEVPDRLDEVPRDRTVVVYCHGGGRSAMVAGYLEQSGFRQVVNLAGGIDAWSISVDPRVPRYD